MREMKAPVIPTEVDEKERIDKRGLNLDIIFENKNKDIKASPSPDRRKIGQKEILGFNMKRVDLLHQLNQKVINDLKYLLLNLRN